SNCFIALVLHQKRLTECVMGLGNVRLKGQGLAVFGNGFIKFALKAQRESPVAQGIGVSRMKPNGRGELLDGIVEPSLLEQSAAEVQVNNWIIDVGREFDSFIGMAILD